MEIEEIFKALNFSSLTFQILTPILFSLADIITGFIQAVINKNVDSSKMRTGLLHKVLIMLVVFLGFVADLTFNLNFIAKLVCIYIIVMETISIFENLQRSGLKFGKLEEILKIKGGEKNNEIK